MTVQKKNITQLFFPIFFEILFYMLSGMVDTLMLSTVNDQAVGAVGTANTYIGMFIIMFNIISSGMIAVMTQYIGAEKLAVAVQAKNLGLLFNGAVGVVLSILLFFSSASVLKGVGIADSLLGYATIYMKIIGGTCILNAIIPIFASYLRAFGYTKQPLFATIVGNVINFLLNCLFLFQFHMGVTGVAIATVISRIINLLIVIYFSKKLIRVTDKENRMSNKYVLGQIIKIGFPSALESIFYNIAMTLIIRFLNQMDSSGIYVTARSYTVQIANFSYCAGVGLANANAIITGWQVGAKKYEKCYKATIKATIVGVVIALGISGTIAIFSHPIIHFFTEDKVLIDLIAKLLIVDIFLEFGRVTNLVYGGALKTSGDATFPMVIGAIFMFICGVGGTWFFGIKLQWLVIGSYIAMASDEIVRGIFVYFRWRSRKWQGKALTK